MQALSSLVRPCPKHPTHIIPNFTAPFYTTPFHKPPSHVDSREGPPGTGKSHVKGLLTLVLEIAKLLREYQPGLGEEITVVHFAQNAAIIEFIQKIYKIVGPSAAVIGSTGRFPVITERQSYCVPLGRKQLSKCQMRQRLRHTAHFGA